LFESIKDPLSRIGGSFMHMFIENSSIGRYKLLEKKQYNFGTYGPDIMSAIDTYLTWKESYTNRAFKTYKVRLDTFKKFLNNDTISISEIRNETIYQYHKFLRETGYSDKTIEYSTIIIKNFFVFWSGRGIATLNPTELKLFRCASPEKNLVDEKDFAILNNALDEHYYIDLIKKLAINILWDTGVRISELVDIDLTHLSYDEGSNLRYATIRRRKSFKYNIVTWSERTNQLLNQYLGMRLDIQTYSDALFLLNKKNAERITARSIQRWILELSDKYLVNKKLTPHCFRHSKAHRIIDVGENVRDVQAILGHTNPISSFHYLQINKKKQLEVAKKYL
jgi:site-specific recombinase XerD